MRPKRSKYDEYFVRQADRVQCRMCSRKFSWNYKHGTNTLRLHLATFHRDAMRKLNIDIPESRLPRGILDPLYRRNLEKENAAAADSSTDTPPSESPDEMEEEGPEPAPSPSPPQRPQLSIVRRAETPGTDQILISMICQEELPLRMLETRGFINFLRVLTPNFELQSKEHYLEEKVPELISKIEKKIREELMSAQKMTIAIDTYVPESYMFQVSAIYAYYMNTRTMALKKILIDYMAYPKGPVDLDSLLSRLQNLVDIKDKVITYHQQFKEDTSDETVLPSLNGLFDDIIHESFDPELIDKQKNVLLGYLDNELFGVNLNGSETGLSKDVLRRPEKLNWKQTKEVIDLILDAVDRRLLLGNGDGDFVESTFNLTDKEHEVSTLMSEILKDFYEPTTSITHRFYPTASVIIPTLRVFGFHIDDMDEEYIFPETQEALTKLKEIFESKLVKCQNNMILKTATYLDPRFRGRFFSEPHEEYMKNKVAEIFREKEDKSGPPESPQLPTFPEKQADNQKFEKELLEYKSEALDSITDPCDFWKSNKQRFPILKSLVSEYLAIPASTPQAEDLFETGEKIYPLTEDTVTDNQNLVYCYANLGEYGN